MKRIILTLILILIVCAYAAADELPTALEEIPETYLMPASEQGTLEDLYYETWESFSYEDRTQPLTKHAVVYLPYGYDADQPYNIIYLMHGGGGTEERTLGSVEQPSTFKNVVDHLIQDGKAVPFIIVCPTYNNTNQNGLDSNSFSLAMQLTNRYHNELVNDLLPAVESRYSTFAENTTSEGLTASRRHRAFVGYSMGSVTTWRTFQYALDYFYYFMPMSCGTTLPDEEIFAAAEGHAQDDYFVWVSTGTADFAYGYDENRVDRMRNSPYFTEGENFVYLLKEDPAYTHGPVAEAEYTYNGMMWFWTSDDSASKGKEEMQTYKPVTAKTLLDDIMNDPLFGGHGHLLLPESHWSGRTLGDLRITYYGHPDTAESVDVINKLRMDAAAGNTVFFDIYSEEEKADDPWKAETGLFFFRGEPGAKTAIVNAGGAFAFVGTMQDSFPHCLELSRKGYNAFAMIYRPGWVTAMEDLGRAIAFLWDHQEELQIDMRGYSLWGGSAGARMAATLGELNGLRSYTGRNDIPQAAAVIMQYTGHSDASRTDAPTYVCVGTNDGIASWRTMQRRLEQLSGYGIPTEFHAYEGLPHGFGLGIGTSAEGWIHDAVAFWERNMK